MGALYQAPLLLFYLTVIDLVGVELLLIKLLLLLCGGDADDAVENEVLVARHVQEKV